MPPWLRASRIYGALLSVRNVLCPLSVQLEQFTEQLVICFTEVCCWLRCRGGTMLGQHLCGAAFGSRSLLSMAALYFLASSLCFLPCCQESCCISRYHTRVRERKKAKEEGRHPYRQSEIFPRNPDYVSVVRLWHGSLLVALELVDRVQYFCLRALSPQTKLGLYWEERQWNTYWEGSCLPLVHSMTSSWNQSCPHEPSPNHCYPDCYWCS